MSCRHSISFAAACAVAATIACSSTDRSVAKNDQSAMTVTGCLQKDGGTFIVTRLNEPAKRPTATSGSSGAVQKEDVRAAANAYRVNPKGDVDLDGLVGKEISVTGVLAERADLPQTVKPLDKGASATDTTDISKGDLAQIDATSVSRVADSCH